MIPFPATLLCDFYKISHREQYPDDTRMVYATWTPRSSRKDGISEVIAFGFQGFIKKYLIDYFNEHFFARPKADVVAEYKRVIKYTLGIDNPSAGHIMELHDLGYLPIMIQAVPEGTRVPIRVPMLTINNTHPKFFWLTNYLETLMSTELWQASTSATIADQYKSVLDKYAMETVGSTDFVPFQGHDFSMRGMGCLEASMVSGAGHLLSFVGTDTIPAILYHERYYNANIENEMVGTSIPSSEHSVMCAYGKGNEFECFERLITEVYPSGFFSVVSDTWDLWKVLSDVIAPLKEAILARDGKVVIRPDSGDPVLIVCGDPNGETEAERKGVVEILWDIFGGTVSEQGYKVLDSHIGCIYGDAITIERCTAICENLKKKGFASVNTVYGIGSWTYTGLISRDTFGFALKSTLCQIGDEEIQIFKDPKTDDGTKKSQKGAVAVLRKDGVITYEDGKTLMEETGGDMLDMIFANGELLIDDTLENIRERIKNSS